MVLQIARGRCHPCRKINPLFVYLAFLNLLSFLILRTTLFSVWLDPFRYLDGELDGNVALNLSIGQVELLSLDKARRFSSSAYAAYEQDKSIDPAKEEERCKRYGFTFDGRKARRRIFWGSLLADDSWQVLYAHAAEAYGIYHAAAFVESNTTQSLSKRKMRFTPNSTNLERLTNSSLFGHETRVTVDYYFDDKDPPNGLHREHLQRQSILERWHKNGMRKDDVGILGDVDEVFTRDFLRALQICSIPQFEPGQDCQQPKLVAMTLIFHASPECIVANKNWNHPDAMIGECIDLIGDEMVHKPPLRTWKDKHSYRTTGHGLRGPDDFQNHTKMYGNTTSHNKTMYPLWNGADFRRVPWGTQPESMELTTMRHTAFHLHNFFETVDEIRNKYLTYGHPDEDARTKPLASLSEALNFTVKAVLNMENDGMQLRLPGGFASLVGPSPLFFQDEEYRKKRHEQLRQMIEEDERVHGRIFDFQ